MQFRKSTVQYIYIILLCSSHSLVGRFPCVGRVFSFQSTVTPDRDTRCACVRALGHGARYSEGGIPTQLTLRCENHNKAEWTAHTNWEYFPSGRSKLFGDSWPSGRHEITFKNTKYVSKYHNNNEKQRLVWGRLTEVERATFQQRSELVAFGRCAGDVMWR